MKKHLKNLFATVVIPTIFITGFSNAASATNINSEIANINYWYADDDIRGSNSKYELYPCNKNF